jgi:uncharacterized membrane protein
MDFAGLLKESWEKFFTEIVPLVLFTLVGGLLCFTIILIPTVAGGWVRGFLAYAREGASPSFEELWNFDDYLPIALMILLASIGISIGYMLLFIPGVIFSVWWLYAMFFLLDRDMGVVEAFGASKEAVTHDGFVNHLVIFLILVVLGMLGGALSGIGSLFTTPFGFVLVAIAYLDLTASDFSSSEETREEAAGAYSA